MADFKEIVDSKIESVSIFKSVESTVANAVADGTRALLTFSEGLPYVGPVAQLLNAAISICDTRKCNKEAFKQLKIRLYRFSQLFFGEGGLADIATKRSQNEILSNFTKRMEDILNESIVILGAFSKVGFLSSLLLGSKPQQQFNQLDAELTACMNELSFALQAVQINEQVQTYQVVCDIQSKIDSNGGLQGVNNDNALLQSIADEIGADVEDLKVEVKDSLDRIEATINQVDANVKITQSKVDGISRDLQILMSVLSSPSGKITSADQATISLTSTPAIDYSKVLGQGTFGTVYEGSYNNELVAVKVISTTTAAGLTPAQLNELSKEVLMHSKVCNLPGVVRLYGANLTIEPRCVVLELADGSLHDVLHKNRPSIDLSMTSKLSLAVQVSSAMACISDMGVVHRDIKSSNVLIFLQSQGRVSAKLADFGLAKIDTENTYATSQTPKGTPPYMAPELFKGEYSSASDVYAFAVMLNEMLLREVPFPSVTVHEIMMKVVTHKARPNAFTTTPSDKVGCRLMSMINSCWNQDPQLRMTFQALASELSQLLAASVEIARNGTNRPVSGIKGEPTTLLSPQSPETAITTLAEWLTSSCSLLPYDSTSLAHTLVTTKCITSVAALSEVMLENPDMLTQELKIARAYDNQIKKAINLIKREVSLKDLSIEQVCLLLDDHNLHSIKPIIEENSVSGTVLSASFDTVDDLKEIGIKPVQAKALFKLIGEWKAHGLPATFLRERDIAKPSGGSTKFSKKADPTNGNKDNHTSLGSVGFSLIDYDPMEVEKWYTAVRYCGGTSACNMLIAAAESGNHLAEACLGILYADGCNELAKDVDKALVYTQRALPWLQAEVAKGNKVGQYLLGAFSESGIGVTKNETEAVRLYTLAAYQGNALAQCKLGLCYQSGRGVTKNEAEAARLFKLAADKGYSFALNNLGVCYAKGAGVSKNEEEAFRLFKLAVDQGHVDAQHNLGQCYAFGSGVTKDEAEAVRLYKLAADQGDAYAQCSLGECYRDGTGVTKDEAEAARLYKLAADQGDVEAEFLLGECYQNGTGVIKDDTEASRLYKLAADQGHAVAQFSLGVCCEKGLGVDRNQAEATRLFKLAADQGHSGAQYHLGVCFEKGNGVAKDTAEATKLYKLAADQCYAAAQYSLGVFYEKGIGVTKDEAEAARLYKLAADQDYCDAQYNLGVCYTKGIGVSKYEYSAYCWYQRAADQGHVEAQYILGVCHTSPGRYTGVDKSRSRAKMYLKMAADQGHAKAADKLARFWF